MSASHSAPVSSPVNAPRKSIPTYCFALVVVRLGHRFLVVQETKKQQWYLPAGRVEPGESFAEAAIRETMEEAGIQIAIEGILRIEHTPRKSGTARCRVIFLARPVDDTRPKSVPDQESLRAAWVTMDDLARIPNRGQEMRRMFEYVLNGGQVFPLAMLQQEGAPF
ncbi:MAG: NUDIX domain-containing protein [Bradymonadia bacterium]